MSSSRTKPRVLVIDDNLQSLKMLRFLLSDQGYEVTVASEGPVARELLETAEDPIHLIILDVMMPNIDGFTLCRQMRTAGETVPIIFLSARNEPTDKAEGLKIGGDDYVVKPFGPNKLLARNGAVHCRNR